MPNRGVDVNSRPRSACYPQSTFYPLSDGAPTSHRRITRSRFRACSTRRSRSQATFYPCARRTVAVRAEVTVELLRYRLGGNRPSQTDPLAASRAQIHGRAVRTPSARDRYFTGASAPPEGGVSKAPGYATHAQTAAGARIQ